MSGTGPSALRLHHHAYVSSDLEATRAFYEDVCGLPLVATWTEGPNPATNGSAFCHVFFELADGSALAFFQFSDSMVQLEMTRPPASGFDHVALLVTDAQQAEIAERAESAGITPLVIDHGYCTSLYLGDPDGLLVEFTIDNPAAVTAEAVTERRGRAHDDLQRWLAGDDTDNNPYRPAH